MKSGIKTTEFWTVAVPGLIISIIEVITASGIGLPGWAGPLMTGLYALSRGLAKMQK